LLHVIVNSSTTVCDRFVLFGVVARQCLLD
jgi:hypothetical protein